MLTTESFNNKLKRYSKLANGGVARPKYHAMDTLSCGRFGVAILCKRKTRKLFTNRSSFDLVVAKVSKPNMNALFVEFYNEVAMLRMLAHKNIVVVHEAFVARNEQWIVFEHMDGGDLRRLCMLPGRWTEPLLACVMEQLLQALHHMHCNHVIHCDVKPDNVLWDSKGNVKLADFGLAVGLTKEKPTHKGLFGTNGYRAPEMLDGAEYNCNVDIWSLGVMAVELIEGQAQIWDEVYGVTVPTSTSFPSPNQACLENATDAFSFFLLAMLDKSPQSRASAKQLLKHEFIINNNQAKQQEFKDFVMRVKGRL